MDNIRLSVGTTDYTDAKNYIYGLAHVVCRNGKEQKILLDTLHEIEYYSLTHGDEGHVIIRKLLNPIMDGLQYGNWPWIKNGVNILMGNGK